MKKILSYNLIIFPLLHAVSGDLLESEKIEICDHLDCNRTDETKVCGLRVDNGQTVLKIFNNECELLQYGCQVDTENAYGIINMEYCEKTTPNDLNETSTEKNCDECPNDIVSQPICGIREDGKGYRIRHFDNECLLLKHNCELDLNFRITDLHICNRIETNVDNKTDNVLDENNDTAFPPRVEKDVNNVINYNKKVIDKDVKIENLVIVDGLGSVIDKNNVNESIDNFFAATHVFDLPLHHMQPHLNESMRRMLLKVAGPLKIFRPLAMMPKKDQIKDDKYHKPTLSTCFHKCPEKCPETYAPVCGSPGMGAREPSLTFKNHCYMDQAQCKVRWEDKSDTAGVAAYIESSFIFCMGDTMRTLYRFLPLIRTLQHMGRLKLKGNFRYKLKNMRFFNNYLSKEPNFMG